MSNNTIQNDMKCGIESLRILLRLNGLKNESDTVSEFMSKAGLSGNKIEDMISFLESNNIPYTYQTCSKHPVSESTICAEPNLVDIQEYINGNQPILLSVNKKSIHKNFSSENDNCYIVLSGYTEEEFIYLDPCDGEEHRISSERLMESLSAHSSDQTTYLLTIHKRK